MLNYAVQILTTVRYNIYLHVCPSVFVRHVRSTPSPSPLFIPWLSRYKSFASQLYNNPLVK
jgi:hypothetical protein